MHITKYLLISVILLDFNAQCSQKNVNDLFDEDKKGSSDKSKIDANLIEGERTWSQIQNFHHSNRIIGLSNSPASRKGNTSSPQTRKSVEKNTNIDIEVSAPSLVSGGTSENKTKKRESSNESQIELYNSPSPQLRKFADKDIPKTKTQSLSLEKEKKGSRKEYPGETLLPKKEKQGKHVSHKNGKQENIREFNSDESQESDVVEIDGFLDSNKKALLKKHSHLSLYGIRPTDYGIRPTEEVKNSSYFKEASLIVSPETINPDVISIRLKLCRIRDQNIEHIGDFKKLKKLELPTNQITDVGVSYIINLSQLETLDLTRNCITDEGVKEIAQMPLLTTLNLSSNKKVTDDGIEFLKNHRALQRLIIKITSVSENKYNEISKWKLKELVYYPSK